MTEIKTVTNNTPHDDYDHSSKAYDLLLNPFLNRIRNALVDWAIKHQPERILDVGCGTGKQLSLLPANMNAVGIDLSDAMLDRAAKQAPGKCQQADATDIPFHDNSFDLILSQFALHEKETKIINLELKEVKRLLKPEGIFSVVDFDFPDDHTFLAGFFKWGVRRIEQQAGDEHFENFKVWMNQGGLREILRGSSWSLMEEQLFFKGNVRLTFWRAADA
ncbi:MAG: methyltransferase domain-containing protein [Candidatus Marinimicrobia bacterium]|nr:methyltransferase domain-containing protein [Candidatus Neomarinimicrobiota bacterium]